MGTVKEELGWLPTSVWHITKCGDIDWNKFIDDKGDPIGKVKQPDGWYKHQKAYPYSSFNPLLAERIYRYWSEAGEHVLDPFAGRTTRGLVAIGMGRNYEGYEIAAQTYQDTIDKLDKFTKEWQPELLQHTQGQYKIHNDDGTELKHTADNSADCIVTCPPYWKLEVYEEAIGQLSRINSYQSFLYHIRNAAVNCQRCLKPGRYCVWVVGDFRLDNKLYSFHNDCINEFKYSGLQLWDIVINQLNSPMTIAAAQARRMMHTLKIHEYILVFKK